jgi:hypothetical protein
VTIDERLDRLTERHEALTQSAELLLRESQEHTRQIGSLREAAAALLQIPNITNVASPAWKTAVSNPKSLRRLAGPTASLNKLTPSP